MLFSLVLAILVAGPTQAREPTLPAGYHQLLGTASGRVDLEGDGKVTVRRSFDSRGELTDLEYIDKSTSPTHRETLTIREQRRFWVRTFYEDDVITRVERERYGARESLRHGEAAQQLRMIEREILWRDEGAADFNHRQVIVFDELSSLVTEYQLVKGEWKKSSESKQSLAMRADDPTRYYMECLAGKEGLEDPGACRKTIEEAPLSYDKLTAQLGVDRVERLECRQNDVLFLPNGYRVDLHSCSTKGAVDAIKAATNEVTTGILGCVRELNPKYARIAALTLATKRPLLKCASSDEFLTEEEFCMPTDDNVKDREACLEEWNAQRESTGAFTRSDAPIIYLTAVDPMKAWKSGPRRHVPAVILHETFHQAGNWGGENHNEHPPDYGDSIYGCQSLCDPMPSKRFALTAEGCRACLNIAGNKPSKAMLSECDKFPPSFATRELLKGVDLKWMISKCDEGDSEACHDLKNSEKVRSICGRNLTILGSECRKKIAARSGDYIRKAAASPRAADSFTYQFRYHNERVVIENGKFTLKNDEWNTLSGDELIKGTLAAAFCDEVVADPRLSASELRALWKKYSDSITYDNVESTRKSCDLIVKDWKKQISILRQ